MRAARFLPLVGEGTLWHCSAQWQASTLRDTKPWPGQRNASPAVVLAFLADALDRHHLLILVGVEHDHALGRAAGDADALDAGADELAAVGDQHDLVGVLDRERPDDAAGLGCDRHGDNAFAAAPGGAV